ncbi:amidohydrolase family protein [Amycolatopsis rhabdoformis]|uniref:Amidohydrolase family protein n=1 Tax=Amycolatopsis rhabdoformis TaxID=1448059 RepID=A0ABZ1IJF8_9PSEU|nr:amidohydrolase family protein [Amycolatopsis rhabdoformis]WSE34512.1 amidohydrolase family protein [Amycolatopsis rhabdoformis]
MDQDRGWVDIHAHFSPPTTADQRDEQWRGLRAARFVAPEPYHWTPEAALASMDRLGIAVQLLSPVPLPADDGELRAWNDYGAHLVARHPGRFGLLAGLPTHDPDAALAEIERGDRETHPDGYLLVTRPRGVPLSDPRLAPVWAELNRRHAVLFVHPSPEIAPPLGQPAALVEVAFETTRAITDLLYTGFFHRYPDLVVVLAHCGGALPALSGRLQLLGAEPWMPNPEGLSPAEIRADLARLYLDTAATGADSHLAAAVTMVPRDHFVYGGDAGVPCSNDDSLGRNITALRASSVLAPREVEALGRRGFDLFPGVAARYEQLLATALNP